MTQPRCLTPGLRCLATAISVTTGATSNAGRWRLYSGAVIQQLWDLGDKRGGFQAVDVVVDLSTVRLAKPAIPALYNHWSDAIVGCWKDGDVRPTGEDAGIYASLDLYRTGEGHLPEADRVAALLDAGHPWEASIGGDERIGFDLEEIKAGTTVSINGRTVQASSDRPLFIARNVTLREASIVPFGADGQTGRIAAALAARPMPTSTRQENPMADLKALLARPPAVHHGLIASLVAADKPEAEIDAAVTAAIIATKDAEITDLKAQVKAAQDQITVLKAGKGSETTPNTTGGDGTAQPKTRLEAHALLRADGFKGAVLVSECRKRWPTLV